jgi:hypothetical protein
MNNSAPNYDIPSQLNKVHPTDANKKKGYNEMNRRELISNAIDDMVIDFLYYNRREDEELSDDDIFEAIKSNEITIDEMCDSIKTQLVEWYEANQ